ncbi:MAG: tRNA uridine-5-carboxymethylaminomethyl(34) synthesis GTPase MnmE [Simkaniaceae bacterium]|nr:tRNA uridine-5-carboxymethylaminomethyl(34) synthesis GTPase MnmE [Simkaniaceae bacterium]
MEFVHGSYEKGQTIAAVATPPGEGGVAIIRISGNDALLVGQKIFSGPVQNFATHTVHFGQILDEGEVIDEGLFIPMKGSRSYTGEDTVEIHCHGGILITERVLQAALKAGARAALPGEFTAKAFLNGKLDLTQAEAVQALIGSKNEKSLQAAKHHLDGRLYQKISSFQKKLFDLAAIFEAWVDFPEEGLEFASMEEVIEDLETIVKDMDSLLDTFNDGSRLFSGFTLCLLGDPNVGKSSLLNALTGKNRAIVTDIPGTTRDLIEEQISIGDLHFKLIDTAGLRETDEVIEKEGIARSKQAALEADLVLYIQDVRSYIPHSTPPNTLVVLNKADLPHTTTYPLKVSALTGEGLPELKEAICKAVFKNGSPNKEDLILLSRRHFLSLQKGKEALETVISGLKSHLSPEWITSDMRLALHHLGNLIGTNITEDLLSAIFSKFCVGK